jgi:hypothetical protein
MRNGFWVVSVSFSKSRGILMEPFDVHNYVSSLTQLEKLGSSFIENENGNWLPLIFFSRILRLI